MNETILRCHASPENIVDADDALRLGVATVVDDGSLGLHPDIAPVFSQHAVLAADRLSLAAHCGRRTRQGVGQRQTV